MARENYNGLLAFLAVAQEQSFTRAAARLGVSQSALSHTIRALETRMGVRLLTRTTRKVSPSEAGQRLVERVGPRFAAIRSALQSVNELRDQPAGTLRISASENAADTILWPRLAELLPKYPQIKVELTVESRFIDIVAERYDMGIRLGSDVAACMTAVRIGPDLRVVIVAAPAYLARQAAPAAPADLARHDCINLRLMSQGEIYGWELRHGAQQVNARVDGTLVFNRPQQILGAALAGFGLAYVLEDIARAHIEQGLLVPVLQDWCPSFEGYHLYYPTQHQLPRAMSIVIDALRYQGPASPSLPGAT